jgi:hypothetical protein
LNPLLRRSILDALELHAKLLVLKQRPSFFVFLSEGEKTQPQRAKAEAEKAGLPTMRARVWVEVKDAARAEKERRRNAKLQAEIRANKQCKRSSDVSECGIVSSGAMRRENRGEILFPIFAEAQLKSECLMSNKSLNGFPKSANATAPQSERAFFFSIDKQKPEALFTENTMKPSSNHAPAIIRCHKKKQKTDENTNKHEFKSIFTATGCYEPWLDAPDAEETSRGGGARRMNEKTKLVGLFEFCRDYTGSIPGLIPDSN